MPGPDPAVAATRLAVREHLADVPAGGVVLVACSGGPDSVALAAALAFEAPRAGVRGGAVVVDHGLQDRSAQVAEDAAALCREMGLDPVEVVRAEVRTSGAGLEADARSARYAAMRGCRRPAGRVHGAHRSHARRPGRAGAARPVAGARVPGRSAVCRCAATASCAPFSPCRAPRRSPPARPTASTRGTTPTTATTPSAGSGRGGCSRRSSPTWGRGSLRRSPAAPTCCARTPTTSRASP